MNTFLFDWICATFLGTKKSVCESGDSLLAKKLFIFKELFLAAASLKSDRFSFVMFAKSQVIGATRCEVNQKVPKGFLVLAMQQSSKKFAVMPSNSDPNILNCFP